MRWAGVHVHGLRKAAARRGAHVGHEADLRERPEHLRAVEERGRRHVVRCPAVRERDRERAVERAERRERPHAAARLRRGHARVCREQLRRERTEAVAPHDPAQLCTAVALSR
jgi:hypothetical protein